MRTDSMYRQNQEDARKRWLKKNPDYYKTYRKKHSEYTRKNREAQGGRNRKNRHRTSGESIFDAIAKMDMSNDEYVIKPGNYKLISAEGPDIAEMDVIIIVNPLKSISYSDSFQVR